MKTPKEKAIELIDKFKPYMYCFMGSGMLSNTYDATISLDYAIECSLICVEEIQSIYVVDTDSKTYFYWEEVKNELLKLKE